ncbi:MAG: metallophosphoesterase [Verrucomicrobiaceae bacterium]|nr:metallophosphoesterase [Verrucomicrobiaceae bacterium]
MLDDLKKQISKGLRPDLVCITGDIINQGQNNEEEFKLARELFLLPLANFLDITPSDFFYVPCNHEVDWSKTSEIFEKGLASTGGNLWIGGVF